MLILVMVLLLSAAVILCGYTTVQLPVRRRKGKLHIACVGDSITYGCTLPLFFLHRYPAVLQRLLGPAVQCAAFGVNDRTLQNSGNKPFRKEAVFRRSIEFQPDTVVVLLGTNDSKDSNWVSAESFRQEYKELIREYRSLASPPYILPCTPPCAFHPVSRFFYLTNDAKLDRIPEIAEAVIAVAEEERLACVDLYSRTIGHRELFGPDGLHPNTAGARLIAEEIAAAVRHAAEN